jgi:hypothetical protein
MRGGFYKHMEQEPIMNFVIVREFDKILAKVTGLGGKVVMRKMRSYLSAPLRSSGIRRGKASASGNRRSSDSRVFLLHHPLPPSHSALPWDTAS